ncbi:Glu-tRNA(Gln) amidotransferase subunit GatE [Candidatus Woesearchaeota archaeon]|nr:MAG: glutamyl-tRNA(Gln) amidotransferase subunit E [archaeon GW2011_AR18]MBS3162256.1 Glu-tRNA(Gln) amidotransferase subunit GatE [Candidatus Woesearchaeota archaeon]HIH26176.1 Glu-tRNA(Gln) amidotransferase subunit GatE [Nanoarchaeota archaeon]
MNNSELGLKIGLECHQQLDGKKLFCNCPCTIKDEKADFEIKRELRVSSSETGKTDSAALYEKSKGKHFIYEGYNDVNCLIEIDEQPPEDVNKEAFDIALQVALLLKAKPLDAIQFMRKIVIDGSNVSGFQRTALIATNGEIETTLGKVRISSVCLEEESAKKIETTNEYVKYNISRLGIPLIEIATEPDIKTPEHAKETAEKLGMILRSVKGMRRGLGTIRQDINLSIKNNNRVELKGFQDLRSIPRVAENEIKRQLEILKTGKDVNSEVRKVEEDFSTTFLRPMPGASRMYPETDIKLIKITKELLKKIKVPELIAEKVEGLEEKYSISAELARELVKEEINLEEYTKLYPKVEASVIAKTLIETPKEMRARFDVDVDKLNEKHFNQVFDMLNTGKLHKAFIIDALLELVRNGQIKQERFKELSDKDIEFVIKGIIESNPGLAFNAIMGDAMKKLKGKADPKKIVDIIKKLTSK